MVEWIIGRNYVNTREPVMEKHGSLESSSRGAKILSTEKDIVARDIAVRSDRISPM
jgi:hypothetical protein